VEPFLLFGGGDLHADTDVPAVGGYLAAAISTRSWGVLPNPSKRFSSEWGETLLPQSGIRQMFIDLS